MRERDLSVLRAVTVHQTGLETTILHDAETWLQHITLMGGHWAYCYSDMGCLAEMQWHSILLLTSVSA